MSRKSTPWKSLILVTAALLLALSVPAFGDVIISLTPSAGTDLTNLHVGDTLVLDTIASSADAGEHLTSFPDIHLLGQGSVGTITGLLTSAWQDDLTTNPVIVTWQIELTTPGFVSLYNGWPDCIGLPNNNNGCAITNLGSTRPADSNSVRFNVLSTPEPASLALLASGMLPLLGAARKKFWPVR